MLVDTQKDFNIDMEQSILVGDIEAGINAI